MSDDREWQLTLHAAERFHEMDLTSAEVLEALDHPEVTYGSDPRYSPTTRTYQAGRLAVVADPTTRSVVTILWRTDATYERGS